MATQSGAGGQCPDPNGYYCDSRLGPRTYDQVYAPHYAPLVAFYVDCAQTCGGPVLEIGAGTGLVTWPIAAAGIEIVGIDIAPRMLDFARAKQDRHDAATGRRIAFLEADMADFRLDRRFRTIIVPGRAFQHLTTPDAQHAALTCMHDHLEPDGVLVMNLFDANLEYCVPDAPRGDSVENFSDANSGQRVRRSVLSRTVDPLTQVFSERLRIELFDAAGTRIAEEETEWSLRWSYQQEMRYLFALTGFRVEALYSDFDRSPPAYRKEQVWIVRRA